MPDTIPDLWSNDIQVTVLPPAAVLKVQERLLGPKTRGLLQAKLSSAETDRLVQHQFDLIAPGLDFYQERILTATHQQGRYYPVVVQAACFTSPPSTLDGPASLPARRQAATEEEFIHLVREVLQSVEVRSLIQSLVARLNEQTGTNGGPEDNGAGPLGGPPSE